MKTFAAILAAAALASASASCPSLCSGHGACTADDKCQCWAGYTGYDCSKRACPQIDAWAIDNPEDAHAYAECAGKGLCDYSTGLCQCFDGYTGRACERSVCPNDCSGHGKCRTIADLPGYGQGTLDATPKSNVPTVYGWDEKAITACVCDGGYMGPDCSQRICPFGDDPMTVCEQGDTEQIQTITVDIPLKGQVGTTDAETAYDTNNSGFQNADGSIKNFAVQYTTTGGKTFYTEAIAMADISAGAVGASTNAAATAALTKLPNFAVKAADAKIHTSVVTASGENTHINTLEVTFQHESSGNSFGKQNLMACPHPRHVGLDHNGARLTTFGCGKDGCQPKILQPRFVSKVTTTADDGATALTGSPAYIDFTAESVLTCPTGKTCNTDKEFVGGIMTAAYIEDSKVHLFVAGAGSEDLVTLANAKANTGTFGMHITDEDGDMYSQLAASHANVDWKYFGKVEDHPESAATAGNYFVDISQIMPDTTLEIDVSALDTAIAASTGATAKGVYNVLQYVPARCNLAEDMTVDYTTPTASALATGTPMDNLDVENIECSGRGECDRATGTCQCYEGYSGLSCGSQTTLM